MSSAITELFLQAYSLYLLLCLSAGQPSTTAHSTSCSPCIIPIVAYMYSMLLQLLHMPICVPPHLAKANADTTVTPTWLYCC